MRRILLQVSLAGVTAGTAWAQDTPAESAPPRPPDWSAWQWYLGTWSCSGPLAYGGTKSSATAAVTHELTLDGFFLQGSVTIVGTKHDPYFGGFRSLDFWTIDRTRNEMRYAAIDNLGSIESGSGPGGWTGDTYESSGDMKGMDATGDGTRARKKVKQSWKKVSDREYRWRGAIGDPAVSEWDWTCKK